MKTRPPACFRFLVRLLPRKFRESHGERIGELASEYARGRSAGGRAIVWFRAALDVLAVGISVRMGVGSGRGLDKADGASRRRSTMDGVAQDVGYGVRSLRRDMGFTLFATVIVGLGVGATVTVFSVVHALMLKPLPFEEPERLVWISNGDFERGQQLSSISVQVAYVVDLRTEATQFTDVAGYHLFDRDGDHTLASSAEPERVTRLRVTENLFAVLGIEPVYGRLFTAEEAWDDGPSAIVLTHGFWERRFGSDPAAVGRVVNLDGVPTTVVGVLPPSFDFTSIFAPGRRIDYVTPFPLSAQSNNRGNTLGLIGRLAPGATVESATAEAVALAARPPSDRRNSFNPVVRPLRDHVSGAFRSAMLVLMGAVAFVMLIVCANLSNLLLSRGATRDREMAIRAALGAPRRRLIQQMLTESALLSSAGAMLGIVLARYGTGFLASLDLRIPLLSQARVDGAALTVALLLAVGVGLLFGVAPALRGTDLTLHESLKDSARGTSHGHRQGALRTTLVVSEVAIACLLLVASTLMVRSFLHVLDVDLGYQADRAIAMRIDPPIGFQSDAERVAYYSEVLERVGSAPGVTAVGLSDVLPMGFNRRWSLRTPELASDEAVSPYVRVASDGYVAAMGLSLVSGRDFLPQDDPGSPSAALVNETLAGLLWPETDPIGRTVQSSGKEYTVIGVVRDTRQLSAEQEPGPEVFFTIRQLGDHRAVHLILRGVGSLDNLVATAREELRAIDLTLALDEVVVMQDVVDASVAPRRFLVALLSAFAAFALILASLGIYSVISYSVTQRRREIGIHIALGASASEIRSRIGKETLTLAAMGLAIGLLAASIVGRVLEGMLFGVTALDPVTYLCVVILLSGVAAAAGYLPARQAARANPIDVLSGDAPGVAVR